MKAKEFIFETQIDEIVMSPTSLQKLASNINATAGMEFEMIVPGVKTNNDPEPDYDADESFSSIDDIDDFFRGEYNSRNAVNRVMSEMYDEFAEWKSEQLEEKWQEEGFEFFIKFINDDYDEDYEMPFDEWAQMEWEDAGRLYWNARENWAEGIDFEESDWLEDAGYNSFFDVARSFSLTWPVWTDGAEESSVDYSEIAKNFSHAVGKPTYYSKRYHGGTRGLDNYVLEPDGSIKPEDDGDEGVEFVSPPMKLEDMFYDLNAVISWAKDKGCYTNESTGLHMNVSVPNYNMENLDYVKLALLLGDEYVLAQYGRESNTYAVSALEKIQRNINNNPEQIPALLSTIKSGMVKIASKLIHDFSTNKYTSINTKYGYVEFRSPGGDWLNFNINELENTMRRFVVALDAACDPQKYRQEYLKKLYKILKPKNENDVISYFAKYVAGEIPKSALKSFVKQTQLKRKPEIDKKLPKDISKQELQQMSLPLQFDR